MSNGSDRLEIRAIDCILYNRRAWRQYVNMLEPYSGGSLVVLPVSRVTGDPVASVAVTRATVTTVLDAVDRALAHLPRHYRKIARLRYDEQLTYPEIAARVGFSEKTIKRRVDRIRLRVKFELQNLGTDILAAFWREIDRKLSAL
ncbi:MAG: hypothetical protein HPY55_16020 [Firmicutes bacterium]|nr:hypothetical protein [Bacillota bacterium]